MEWIVQLPVLFFSVIVHEFCHGWAAYSRGDDTAEKQGRLTLNPLAHLDPFGTVFFPALCFFMNAPMFGWAKPVPVDVSRLRRPVQDAVRVALMGPTANLVLAFAAALGHKLVTVTPVFTPDFKETVLACLRFAIVVNLFLAFFNLVPVHPLDGSKIVGGLLPRRLRRLYERHAPYGMFIILILLFTRALSYLVLWPSNFVFTLLMKLGLVG